ncbi:hypothetical protein BDN72DRAFT_864816 [Pluteus cervinus]|uniref:Uncharacterized protein n=1 Tax=Pluteus cervinus TaxID=181527 RepID=A0ACD3A2B7_9AGAR|nr:hypothetical protein BDN72DRAFT_864816 [Pluteus cervinus]
MAASRPFSEDELASLAQARDEGLLSSLLPPPPSQLRTPPNSTSGLHRRPSPPSAIVVPIPLHGRPGARWVRSQPQDEPSSSSHAAVSTGTPITDTYQATRPQTHHSGGSSSVAPPLASSSQPVRGFRDFPAASALPSVPALQRPTSTTHANALRLRSASSMHPPASRAPTILSGSSRIGPRPRRGLRAHQAGGHQVAGPPTIEDCLREEGAKIQILAKVYPWSDPGQARRCGLRAGSGNAWFYQHMRVPLEIFLTRFFLLHPFTVPVTTTLAELVDLVIAKLKDSDAKYEFKSGRMSPVTTPILPMSLSNSGRVQYGNIKLRTVPWDDCFIALLELMMSDAFVNAKLTIQDCQLVIHFNMVNDVTFVMPDGRRHHCLSSIFTRYFPVDRLAGAFPDNLPESLTRCDDVPEDTEDEDVLMSESDEEGSVVNTLLSPFAPSSRVLRSASASTPAAPSRVSSTSSTVDSRGSSSSAASTGAATHGSSSRLISPALSRVVSSSSTSAAPTSPRPTAQFVLPPSIWAPGYTPRIVRSSSETIEPGANLGDTIFALAGPGLELSLAGANIEEVADDYLGKLFACAEVGDFGTVLAPKRECIIYAPGGEILSTGRGVENEVFHFMKSKYIGVQAGPLLRPTGEGHSTIQPLLSLVAALALSPAHRRFLLFRVLGSIVSLGFAYGSPPIPFSPLLIYLLWHKGDLNCLTPELVSAWDPKLRTDIDDATRLAPGDSLTGYMAQHLINNRDMLPAAAANRDLELHRLLVAEAFYMAIVGTESLSHPDWLAFREGFDLPTSNGFRFTDFVHQLAGGPDRLLSLTWATLITDGDQLSSSLRLSPCPPGFEEDLASALGNPGVTLEGLISGALKRTGFPVWPDFDLQKGMIARSVPKAPEDFEDPSYRAKMFAWAATGSPTLAFGGADTVNISCSLTPNANYAPLPDFDAQFYQGVISFRTCMNSANLPGPHILALAGQTYPNATFPTFVDAFDQWFVSQALFGIAETTML